MSVETVYSTFKRVFGESVMAKQDNGKRCEGAGYEGIILQHAGADVSGKKDSKQDLRARQELPEQKPEVRHGYRLLGVNLVPLEEGREERGPLDLRQPEDGIAN